MGSSRRPLRGRDTKNFFYSYPATMIVTTALTVAFKCDRLTRTEIGFAPFAAIFDGHVSLSGARLLPRRAAPSQHAELFERLGAAARTSPWGAADHRRWPCGGFSSLDLAILLAKQEACCVVSC